MAAIGNTLYDSHITRTNFVNGMPGYVAGAYTFGMPRYCGLGIICSFRGPYHVYRKKDLIPTLPFRKMGFVDCCQEYELTNSGTVALTERTDTYGIAGHIPKFKSSLKAHAVESYVKLLSNAL